MAASQQIEAWLAEAGFIDIRVASDTVEARRPRA
jgi:hypothetical protein